MRATEGSTLADFLHTRTLHCREKSDEFRESSKRMASECDVTSERYCNYMIGDLSCRYDYRFECFIMILSFITLLDLA